ncbi:uncharacterized protein [Musca autumnalis]|uniref:uncharacterized protein n=1 Tax=Musca autumnalis TaxID=221902 RepID=UPI003CFBB445
MAGLELQSGAFNKSVVVIPSNESETGNLEIASVDNCTCPKQTINEAGKLKQKATTISRKQKQSTHPLTICLLVIMAFIVIIPHNVDAAAVRRHLTTSLGDQAATGKADKLLLLSEAIEELAEEYVKEEKELAELAESEDAKSADYYSDSESESYDELSPLDVVRHMERKAEYRMERKNKLSKRYAQHLDNLKYFDGSAKQNIWQNPCNVARENPAAQGANNRLRTHYLLKRFYGNVRKESATIYSSLKEIKIDDMSSWRLYRDYYSFLPKVKQNSSITLSRWYSNMQILLASFGYLGRIQYQWDMAKQQYVSKETKELDLLANSARLMLCELESTINGSHPIPQTRKLKYFTTEAMDKKLQFQVKEQLTEGNTPVAVPPVDLKFAKSAYFKFLAGMRKVLKRKLPESKTKVVKIESSENVSAEDPTNGNDVSQSINISSMMRPDSDLSLGESFELSMKSQGNKQVQQQKKQRRQRKNSNNQKNVA